MAPTDTFIQSMAQTLPEAMQPYAIGAMIFGSALVIIFLAVTFAIAVDHHHKRRRASWDDTLSSMQRKPRRPGKDSWGGTYR